MSSPTGVRATVSAPAAATMGAENAGTARAVAWSLVVTMTLWRVTSLDRSLWWDEVYTAWAYVLRGPDTIRAAEAYIANNHLLFSGLSWATARVLGDSEAVLRLWAFLPGTAATAWATAWLGRRHGWPLAATFAGVLAITPLHVLLTTEARGYGLVLLAGVGVLIGGTHAMERGAARDDVLLAGAGLIGVATIPTFALPTAVVGLVVLWRRRAAPMRLLLLAGAAAGLAWWWYAPVRAPILAGVTGVGARHGEVATALDPLLAPARLLAGSTVTGPAGLLPAGSSWVVLLHVLLAVAIVWGGRVLLRRDRALGLLVLLVPPGTVAAMALLGMHLLPRYLAAVLPAVTIALAAATHDVGATLARRWPRTAPGLLAGLAVALAAGNFPALHAELQPRQDLASVAALVAEAPKVPIVLARAEVGWTYYLRAHDLEIVTDDDALTTRLCAGDTPAWYVEPSLEPRPRPSCLGALDGVRHTLPQRAAPGQLTVWRLP